MKHFSYHELLTLLFPPVIIVILFNSFLIMNTFVEGEELRLVTMASRLHLLVLVLSATAHAQGPDQQGTYTVLYSRVGQLFVVPLAAKWEIKKKQIMILVQNP